MCQHHCANMHCSPVGGQLGERWEENLVFVCSFSICSTIPICSRNTLPLQVHISVLRGVLSHPFISSWQRSTVQHPTRGHVPACAILGTNGIFITWETISPPELQLLLHCVTLDKGQGSYLLGEAQSGELYCNTIWQVETDWLIQQCVIKHKRINVSMTGVEVKFSPQLGELCRKVVHDSI